MFDLFVELLQAAVLALHLICVNLAAGGPVVWLIAEFGGRRGDLAARQVASAFGLLSLKGLFVGALIGLFVGWLRWSEEYQNLLLQTGSRLWFGIAEWAFSFVLLIGCWIWVRLGSWGRWASRIRGILLLVAATNLLYHFPVFFTIIDHLRYQRDPTLLVDSAMFRQLVLSPEILSRSTHVIMACLAVSGVALAWIAQRRVKQALERSASDESEPNSNAEAWNRWYRVGLHIGLWPTLCQLLVGFWILVSLPRETMARLTGQDAVITAALILSLIAAANLIHYLIRGLLRASDDTLVARRCVIWISLTVWLMTWASLLALG